MEQVRGQTESASETMDQCQFGQRSREGNPVKKPTRWMSNCQEILEALDKRCTGRGRVCSATRTPHPLCSGRTAREAAIYPFEMCKAILEGLRKYFGEAQVPLFPWEPLPKKTYGMSVSLPDQWKRL